MAWRPRLRPAARRERAHAGLVVRRHEVSSERRHERVRVDEPVDRAGRRPRLPFCAARGAERTPGALGPAENHSKRRVLRHRVEQFRPSSLFIGRAGADDLHRRTAPSFDLARLLARMMKPDRLIVGVEDDAVHDARSAIDAARAEGFDFVAVPLVHAEGTRGRAVRLRRGLRRAGAVPTRTDLTLNSGEWSRLVIGKLSDAIWAPIGLGRRRGRRRGRRARRRRGRRRGRRRATGRAGVPQPRRRARRARARGAARAPVREELAWASHLSLPAVLLPVPPCVPGDDGARGCSPPRAASARPRSRRATCRSGCACRSRRPTRPRCAGAAADDDGDARVRPDARPRAAGRAAARRGRGAVGGVGRAALAVRARARARRRARLPVDLPSDTRRRARAMGDAGPVQVRGPPADAAPRDARPRASFPPSISSEEAAPLLPFRLPSARCVVLLTSAFLPTRRVPRALAAPPGRRQGARRAARRAGDGLGPADGRAARRGQRAQAVPAVRRAPLPPAARPDRGAALRAAVPRLSPGAAAAADGQPRVADLRDLRARPRQVRVGAQPRRRRRAPRPLGARIVSESERVVSLSRRYAIRGGDHARAARPPAQHVVGAAAAAAGAPTPAGRPAGAAAARPRPARRERAAAALAAAARRPSS